MAKKVKSDGSMLYLMILFVCLLLLASLIRYVQQSGGYYNSVFYTEGVCGMERSMTLSKEKEELEKTLWPYTPK